MNDLISKIFLQLCVYFRDEGARRNPWNMALIESNVFMFAINSLFHHSKNAAGWNQFPICKYRLLNEW